MSTYKLGSIHVAPRLSRGYFAIRPRFCKLRTKRGLHIDMGSNSHMIDGRARATTAPLALVLPLGAMGA